MTNFDYGPLDEHIRQAKANGFPLDYDYLDIFTRVFGMFVMSLMAMQALILWYISLPSIEEDKTVSRELTDQIQEGMPPEPEPSHSQDVISQSGLKAESPVPASTTPVAANPAVKSLVLTEKKPPKTAKERTAVRSEARLNKTQRGHKDIKEKVEAPEPATCPMDAFMSKPVEYEQSVKMPRAEKGFHENELEEMERLLEEED